jgi:chromosomal replication initiation ATPase DnaA
LVFRDFYVWTIFTLNIIRKFKLRIAIKPHPNCWHKTRKRHVVQARQLAMFFAKKFTKASLANIGSQIGDRDHATVLHACKTVDNLVATDKQFKKYMEDIHKKLSL